MSPERQRIVIAEACGWVLKERLFHNGEWKDEPTWVDGKHYEGKPDDYCAPGQWLGACPPNYPDSLDLMHKALEVLTPKQWGDWNEVVRMYLLERIYKVDSNTIKLVWQAIAQLEASDHAEIFLKTIGKWEEES